MNQETIAEALTNVDLWEKDERACGCTFWTYNHPYTDDTPPYRLFREQFVERTSLDLLLSTLSEVTDPDPPYHLDRDEVLAHVRRAVADCQAEIDYWQKGK